METRRRKSGSGDTFSFPSTPIQDQELEFEFEFEFGCVTPGSPSNDPSKNSPADHLFFNGRLLPHAFPLQPLNSTGIDYSRPASRTSSVSSKDSLMSSRSNSTNSRSSSCSSARTSSSENSERKLWTQSKFAGKTQIKREKYRGNKLVPIQGFGNSQRWQFITPAPVLNGDVSRRKRAERGKKEDDKKSGARAWFGRRFLQSFVAACRECHAMEPSAKGNVELH